ncbi:5-formyltetrahydrofolate cyclo-ligase [Elizabethkingia sp. JS20170427COW]|uniref:5-formyltetrahydrofolate cyclo-ligase n=1 Tax=Elizabethkingia sp. JS20170427COW TaxID=2583851 RepID=UPI0011104049|nr:5-formyltetrahydrofolate cyclo-ligase [Elizabethkingia sp. JS20170427COW]QCX52925.1 5-formyltetrahydrofolate cyclo-ligase [Elizabethkingia sp. JS20170427COW]
MQFFTKSELREIYKQKRKAMSDEDIAFLSQKIIENYILQFSIYENQNVSVFLPIEKQNEINTNLLVKYFWEKRINVYVPKVIGDKMISVAYTPNTVLVKSKWGILEPQEDIDSKVEFSQVITPLLYADPLGNRIGYGKGFYDKFFVSLSHQPIKVGFNFFPAKEGILDPDPLDIQLDYLVTPEGILSF